MFSSSSSVVPLITPFKPKAPHAPEPLWKYVTENAAFGKGGSKKWECSFCKTNFAGSYPRVRAYLLGIKNQGIQVCCKVSTENRANMTREDHESAIKKQKTGNNLVNKKPTMQPSVEGMFKNASREEVDEAVARCFYACGMPFFYARSPYFHDMVGAIASFGKGYKAPNYEKLRTTLLDKEKDRVCSRLSGVESTWPHFGCSIVSDGWTDTAKRPLINFIVSSARGVVFKRSIDTSGSQKTGEFIAEALLDIIREVGVDNVVQVITDSAANCKLAGHLVEQSYPHIFWTPCATHCLNLLLKDLVLIEWMDRAITQGKEVQQFISNHDATRAMFSKHSKLKLIRPGDTRFASNFMMLQRLVKVKSPLKQLVTSEEWDAWKRNNEYALHIEMQLLSTPFWEDIEKYVKVLWPVMAMLRMVDRDEPVMGTVYEGIDQMLEKIKEILKEYIDGNDEYEEIRVLAQERWEMLHSPLHATAYVLNPMWFMKRPYKDKDVMKGWRKTLDRVGKDEDEKTEYKAQLSQYIGLQGDFAESSALADMQKLSPIAWWENYGTGTPMLQRLAIRVLSQVSSASACERNWSTYGFIHSMKRNRLGHTKADDLVFVHSNLRLISRKEPSYSSGPCQAWDVLEEDSIYECFEDQFEDEGVLPM